VLLLLLQRADFGLLLRETASALLALLDRLTEFSQILVDLLDLGVEFGNIGISLIITRAASAFSGATRVSTIVTERNGVLSTIGGRCKAGSIGLIRQHGCQLVG